MEHKLVKYEYQATSNPPYRHYCECSCGFQCRLGTKEASQSQFDNHLRTYGMPLHFAELEAKDVKKDWSPFVNK